MGNLIKGLFASKIPKKQCKIVMLGLDSAGKTTILYSLKLGDVISTIPTIGFNVEQLKYKTIQFMVWDVGGQQKLRNLWTHYFDQCRGLIYVVDSSDQERIQLSAKQLNRILKHDDMKNCVVLILANKRDIATLNLEELSKKLGVSEFKRNWAIYPVTAIKNHQISGLVEAMEWLIQNIDMIENPKVSIKVG